MEKVRHFTRNKTVAWAVIELTDFCNFNCAWCYASSGYKSKIKRHQISRDDMEKLIQNLADSGVKKVTYSGGEPTLYPYLKEVIAYARDHGMVVHMNTNGYLLNKKLVNELKSLGLSQVEINIDSIDPEKHDKVREMKGSFQRAVSALKYARDVGITCVVQTVITKNNENEIIDIAKFARSMGAHRYRLWDVLPSGEALYKTKLRPIKYLEILKQLDAFASRTGAKSIEAGEPLFPLDYRTNLKVTDSSCVCATGLLMNISTRGDVYFCCTYRKSLYNIFDAINRGEMIKEFHKTRLKEFLISLRLPSKCRECKLFNRCRGGCPTRTGYTENGVDYWCER